MSGRRGGNRVSARRVCIPLISLGIHVGGRIATLLWTISHVSYAYLEGVKLGRLTSLYTAKIARKDTRLLCIPSPAEISRNVLCTRVRKCDLTMRWNIRPGMRYINVALERRRAFKGSRKCTASYGDKNTKTLLRTHPSTAAVADSLPYQYTSYARRAELLERDYVEDWLCCRLYWKTY